MNSKLTILASIVATSLLLPITSFADNECDGSILRIKNDTLSNVTFKLNTNDIILSGGNNNQQMSIESGETHEYKLKNDYNISASEQNIKGEVTGGASGSEAIVNFSFNTSDVISLRCDPNAYVKQQFSSNSGLEATPTTIDPGFGGGSDVVIVTYKLS